MNAMASQITCGPIVHSTVCSGEDQRKQQSSASLAFVRGIHRWPLNSPHKRPVTRKTFPFDDVILQCGAETGTVRENYTDQYRDCWCPASVLALPGLQRPWYWRWSWGRLNIKMPFYRYRNSHYRDKMISRPSYLYNGNPHQGRRPLHWPLTRYAKLRVAHAPGIPGTFSPPPRVSDPDMHHGTCMTQVPWRMSGSLTSGFLWSWWRGKRSRHSRCMRNPQFCVSGKRPIETETLFSVRMNLNNPWSFSTEEWYEM